MCMCTCSYMYLINCPTQAIITDNLGNIFSFLIGVHYRKVFAILHLVSRYFIQL